MDFKCPNCRLAGRIDDVKVPEGGINAVCPKCQERFLVKKESPPEELREMPEGPGNPADNSAIDGQVCVEQKKGNTAEGNTTPQAPSGGQSIRTATPGSTDDDLRTFIGKNADKYLTKFANFTKGPGDGFALTWHWPAFFLPFWWLVYRKQYWWAVLAFVISFIPFVGLLSMIVFGLTGNYIYYSYSKKKLKEIGALPSEMSRAVEIARAGGVNNIAIVLVPLIGIAVIGVLAAIAIPQFAEYKMKSFNAVAIAELKKAKTSVDTYYAEHKAYPESLEQANYTKPQDMDVHFDERSVDKYTIVATHAKGNKEFAVKSDVPELLYRLNKERDREFQPAQ